MLSRAVLISRCASKSLTCTTTADLAQPPLTLPFQVGALDTFWRSAENFHTTSSYPWEVGTGMTWAVSQADPLRNVKVDNDLLFFQYIPASCCAAGFASGGYGSGLSVGGDVA